MLSTSAYQSIARSALVRFENFAAASAISLLFSDDVFDRADWIVAPLALAESTATISIEANADVMRPLRLPTGFSRVLINTPSPAFWRSFRLSRPSCYRTKGPEPASDPSSHW